MFVAEIDPGLGVPRGMRRAKRIHQGRAQTILACRIRHCVMRLPRHALVRRLAAASAFGTIRLRALANGTGKMKSGQPSWLAAISQEKLGDLPPPPSFAC